MVVTAGNDEASRGTSRLLLFLAFVSINLAVLCWLPIPNLDGGHVLFLAAEGLRGKPVSNKVQLIVMAIAVGTVFAVWHVLPLFSCLTQWVRLIGLLRTKGVARTDTA
jgi:regulator of sigma E protease